MSDRINDPGPSGENADERAAASAEGAAEIRDMERSTGFLKALGGLRAVASAGGMSGQSPAGHAEQTPDPAGKQAGSPAPRRGGLLERITRSNRSD